MEEGEEAAYYRFRGDAYPPEADLTAALALLRQHMQPCDETTIQAELLRLRLTTKSRDVGDMLADVMVAIYADICRDYPADVVVDGLRAWSREEKFWPAEAEIRVFLNRRVHKRRALVFLLTHPEYSP